MTEWHKYPESKPEFARDLLVVINGKILFAESRERVDHYCKNSENDIIFFINYAYEIYKDNIMLKRALGGEWVKPQLYSDITHWMYLPEVLHD